MSGSILGPPDLLATVREKHSYIIARGNSTVRDIFGFTDNTTGTVTARNVAVTNRFTSARRVGFVSAAGAGSSANWRSSTAQFFRSSVANLGGFHFVFRFGLSLLSGGENRCFVGLTSTTGNLPNGQPSAILDMFGIAADVGDTAWQIMHNDGAGAATKVSLGAGMPFPGTADQDFYELELFCAVGVVTTMAWKIIRLDTNEVQMGSISSNLPTADVLLCPQLWVNNGATASAVAIDVIGYGGKTFY